MNSSYFYIGYKLIYFRTPVTTRPMQQAMTWANLGMGEQELQGINSYKGVEDISVNFCKELKAVKG